MEYLRDSHRFPKINLKEIKVPNGQLSGTEYNHIVDMLSLLIGIDTGEDNSFADLRKYTMKEYLDLVYNDEIKNTFYTIYKDDSLYRVYLGKTLVMKKRQNSGENVTMGGVFPIVFPIVFP